MSVKFSGKIVVDGLFKGSAPVVTYANAQALRDAGQTTDGVYEINPSGSNPFDVYCMFDPTPTGVFGSAPTGYNLAAVFNRIDSIPATSGNGTDFYTVEYLNDTLWAELQTSLIDTEAYFIYYDSGGSVVEHAKAIIETPGVCQRLQDTLNPSINSTSWSWSWTDPNCDGTDLDYTFISLGGAGAPVVYNVNATHKYTYRWTGSAWDQRYSYVGSSNAKYLRIFVR